MSYSFNPFTGNFDNVRDIAGTTNQVNVTQTGDNFILSTPQDIHTGATPQFQDVQVLGTGLGNRFVGKTLAQLSSTGVIKGLALSLNADPTKFDIASGNYEIVDNYTDPLNPVVTPVSYAGSTANSVTNLATSDVTYILLDGAGAITQQTTFPSPSERRGKAFIGRLNHSNRTSISFTNTFPDIKNGIVSQFYDLLDAMSPFKIGGLSVSANGANLSFNRSSGSVFFRSNSWVSTPANPHTTSFSAQTLQPFRKITQTTTIDAVDVTVVEPNYYDVGGTRTLNGGGNGTATIQRVFLYKSGAVRVAYGQTVYTNLATALSSINQDPFIPNPTIEQTAILIGYIVLTKDCTDLTNTNKARIITAARFDAGGSAVAGGITSLQQAYLNSVLPQIVLNSTQGAFTIDDASTPIGTLVDIRNNAGTTSYLRVNASGVSTTNFVGTGTTGAVRLHNLTTTQKNALTPADGMLVYDTTLTNLSYYNGSWVSPLSNPMTTGGDLIYGGASGTPTRLANGTANQYLASSGGTSAPVWTSFVAPTVQRFTSGSGTYTTPANVKYIIVEMVGGGGGGSGSAVGAGGGGTAAGAGGNTTFGSSLLVANGGGAGLFNALNGAGGTASVSAPAIEIFAIAGGDGGGSSVCTTTNEGASGGNGGSSAFGGAGKGPQNGAGGNGKANSGSGGGGAGIGSSGSLSYSGSGGGSGGYVKAIINSPSATYSYAVGGSGTAGGAGTSGAAGGAGGAGVIVVTEYYQ